jgi:hypothetical protein
MVQPEIVFIRRPPRPSWDSFASTRTPQCRHVPSVPPRNLRPGFEVQIVLRLNPPNSPRVAYSIRVPRNSTHVTTILDRPTTKSSRASTRLACPLSWLGQHGHSPVHLRLSMSPDVSHRDWSPGRPVPWSNPHVSPSSLLVHWHDTSLLALHFTVDHRLRAPHLRTTSQETCCTT